VKGQRHIGTGLRGSTELHIYRLLVMIWGYSWMNLQSIFNGNVQYDFGNTMNNDNMVVYEHVEEIERSGLKGRPAVFRCPNEYEEHASEG